MTEDELAEKVADRLIGQCVLSLDQVLEEEAEMDIGTAPRSLLEKIDDKVFCCDGCGWYCGTDELNEGADGSVCDDCNEDSDED